MSILESYLLDINDPLKELKDDEFPIKVFSFMGVNDWTFTSNMKHKLKNLKRSLTTFLDADFHEISIIIGPEFPYRLDDEMFLHELLPHHRTLHVIVSENPKKVVPKRLLKYDENHKKILDLREMREEDFKYISYNNWIVTYNYDQARKVYLSLTHPLFDDTLKKIAQEIESSLDNERRPDYPLYYYIDGVGESDNVFIRDHLHSLCYFYEKLNSYQNFRRIRLYLGLENPRLLKKECVVEVSPFLAEKMWEY